MNGLDLFSGIGGISIALEPWVRTVAYCEQDRYAQAVLLSRMSDGALHQAPIWDDVTTLTKDELSNEIDIIFGGFPCQDISVAGNGKGLEGKRSGLFFEIIRLVKEIEPSFVFLENVPAIRTRGLSQVINAFTEIGYDCRWTCLSAASVGAQHKRERWFLLAHPNSCRLEEYGMQQSIIFNGSGSSSTSNKQGEIENEGTIRSLPNAKNFRRNGWGDVAGENKDNRQWKNTTERNGEAQSVAYSSSKVSPGLPSGTREKHAELRSSSEHSFGNEWWDVEPSVGRVVNGLPNRVDRIKCLGNSVVPQQVREAFKRLSGLKIERNL